MTIDQYIAALRYAIRALPPVEIDQAIGYYSEYLHDADDPAAAMAQLGTPGEVAASILASYVYKTPGHTGFSVLWAVILGILAAPVAAPLAIVLFCVALTLLVVVLAVIFSVFAAGLAIGVAGVGAAITGAIVAFQSLATGFSLLGGGLVMAAVGLLVLFGVIQLGRVTITGLARWIVHNQRLRRSSSPRVATAY